MGPTQAGGLAALLAADEDAEQELETRFIPAPPPRRDPIFEDWDRINAQQPVMPPEYVFEPPVSSEPEPTHAPAAMPAPPPVPSIRNGGSSLLARIEHVASGGELSRDETIETLLALIEDGQSSDPVVFGPSAAMWYAQLYKARQAGSTVTD